jgi:hypothetical protein
LLLSLFRGASLSEEEWKRSVAAGTLPCPGGQRNGGLDPAACHDLVEALATTNLAAVWFPSLQQGLDLVSSTPRSNGEIELEYRGTGRPRQ